MALPKIRSKAATGGSFSHAATSRMPRYVQVASVLRRRIEDGYWALGDKITTLDELEREFGVARVTVRQAVDLLQSEGLLKSVQGRGTFVTKTPGTDRWLQLATNWESLIAPIRLNVLEVIEEQKGVEPRLLDDDGSSTGDYRFIRSLQKRGREPYALARVHIASRIYARAPKLFAARAALAVLAEMDGLDLARAHQALTIGAADLDVARRLDIPMNAPVVEARCVVTDGDGFVIYLGEITYRGDVVRLNIELIGQ